MLSSDLPEFRGAFEAAVREQGIEREQTVEYDGLLPLHQIDDAILADFRYIGPFGVGFPEPQFLARDVPIRDCRKVGGNHLSLRLAAENGRFYPAIAFDAGGAPFRSGDRIDCLFLPQYNDFAGRRTLQLRVLRLWRSVSDAANVGLR